MCENSWTKSTEYFAQNFKALTKFLFKFGCLYICLFQRCQNMSNSCFKFIFNNLDKHWHFARLTFELLAPVWGQLCERTCGVGLRFFVSQNYCHSLGFTAYGGTARFSPYRDTTCCSLVTDKAKKCKIIGCISDRDLSFNNLKNATRRRCLTNGRRCKSSFGRRYSDTKYQAHLCFIFAMRKAKNCQIVPFHVVTLCNTLYNTFI